MDVLASGFPVTVAGPPRTSGSRPGHRCSSTPVRSIMAHPAPPLSDQVHTYPGRMIKACLNGDRTRADHPGVPITPAELADAAAAAVQAGADALHLHPRGADERESLHWPDIRAVVEAVRAACPPHHRHPAARPRRIPLDLANPPLGPIPRPPHPPRPGRHPHHPHRRPRHLHRPSLQLPVILRRTGRIDLLPRPLQPAASRRPPAVEVYDLSFGGLWITPAASADFPSPSMDALSSRFPCPVGWLSDGC